MKKTLKLLALIMMAVVVFCASSPMAFATTAIIDDINGKVDLSGATTNAGGLMNIAGQVLSLIQIASAVAAVILVAVFGFKFIMGSANEKADYQKSFIPLIVGVVVVFAATSIAKLLFGIIA